VRDLRENAHRQRRRLDIRRLPISVALIAGVVVLSTCRGSELRVCAEQDRTITLAKTKVSHEIPSAPFEMPAHGKVWIGVTDSDYSPEALLSTVGSLIVVPEGALIDDDAAVVVGFPSEEASRRPHAPAGRHRVYSVHDGQTAEVVLCRTG
jgi:hypothetical protein